MNDNVKLALKNNSYEHQLLVFGKCCFNLGAVYGFGVGKSKGKTLKALIKWLKTQESSDYLFELLKKGEKK